MTMPYFILSTRYQTKREVFDSLEAANLFKSQYESFMGRKLFVSPYIDRDEKTVENISRTIDAMLLYLGNENVVNDEKIKADVESQERLEEILEDWRITYLELPF